jgi:hypothetical protein
VAASGEVVGPDYGRNGEHPGASMSVAWMPVGRSYQQPALGVSDVRRSQRTTRNMSATREKPLPVEVSFRYDITAGTVAVGRIARLLTRGLT